jgi:hypothetical protein
MVECHGFKELSRFGLDPENPEVAKRPSGVFLTDGTLNIAVLKFPENLVGKMGGNLPGYPASHGCVRLPLDFSAKLFTVTHLL